MKRMRISPLLALCYPTWCLAIVFTILPAVLLVVPVAHAQHEHHAQGATITPPGGFGTTVFENSGAREAQEPFLRGIALLHSFEVAAAREAFRAAQQADPAPAAWYVRPPTRAGDSSPLRADDTMPVARRTIP